MKTDVFSTNGRKLSKAELPKEIFGVEAKQALMAQAIRVYLSNQRQAPAKTKRRGEISFSKHKVWKQKGTGRARHGSRSAPIFVKGGKAHGPTGEQNYKLFLHKAEKRKALCTALSEKQKNNEIVIVQGLDKIMAKTKELNKIILDVLQNFSGNKKRKKVKTTVSLILPEPWKNVIQAGRNIPYLNLLQAKQLNIYDVLNGGILIFAKESIEVLKKWN